MADMSAKIKRYSVLYAVLVTITIAVIDQRYCFAKDNEIKAYYPSPKGIYEEVQLVPRPLPSSPYCNQQGELLYDKIAHALKYCDGTSWKTIGTKGVTMKHFGPSADYDGDTSGNPPRNEACCDAGQRVAFVMSNVQNNPAWAEGDHDYSNVNVQLESWTQNRCVNTKEGGNRNDPGPVNVEFWLTCVDQ